MYRTHFVSVCAFFHFWTCSKNKVVQKNPANPSICCLRRLMPFLSVLNGLGLTSLPSSGRSHIDFSGLWLATGPRRFHPLASIFGRGRDLGAPRQVWRGDVKLLVNRVGERWRRARKVVEIVGLRKVWMEDARRNTKRGLWVSLRLAVWTSSSPPVAFPLNSVPPRCQALAATLALSE